MIRNLTLSALLRLAGCHAPRPGRFQVVHVAHPRAMDHLVILQDTLTGHCWATYRGGAWHVPCGLDFNERGNP